MMNGMPTPEDMTADTPKISALIHQDLGRLASQLVLYSVTEILDFDSQSWIENPLAQATW